MIKNKKIFLFILLFGFLCSNIYPLDLSDIFDRYKTPLLEVSFLNGGLCSINKYVGNREWADIGTATIKNNIQSGFTWDNDGFPCNMIDHPYHGAQYYTIARSSGLNYLDSFIITTFGSLQWEYIMETNQPSLNDFMITTSGGAVLGEYFYRFSKYLMNRGDRGLKKYFYNILSFTVSPFTFLNEKLFIKKDYKETSIRKSDNWEFSFDIGWSMLKNTQNNVSDLLNISFNSEYKNRDSSNFSAFDVMEFKFSLFKAEDKLHKRIILNSKLVDKEIDRFGSFGLWTSYKYNEVIENYRYSGIGIGPGFNYNSNFFNFNSKLFFIIGAATARHALIYGDEFYEEKGETYQFGTEIIDGAYYIGKGLMSEHNLGINLYNFKLNFGVKQFWINSFHATDANEHRLLYPISLTYSKSNYFLKIQKQYASSISFYDDYIPINEKIDSVSVIMGYAL